MGEVQLQILAEDSMGPSGSQKEATVANQSMKEAPVANQTPVVPSLSKRWWWWFKVFLFTFFVLTGQTVATLLGRFYYDNGGKSKWINAFLVSAGVLIVLPLRLFPSPTKPILRLKLTWKISLIYVALGIIVAGDNLLYAYGLLYLPVSTFSLVCATQLAFNAVFSYFLNSQKFTALIFNSVVLLTFSAALLGVSSGSENSANIPKDKYPLGFVMTLAASAMFSLILSLQQLTFQKVIKREDFSVVLEMLLCPGFVATVVCAFGLYASGEGRQLKGEMEGFTKGKVSYVVTLVWTAIAWTVSSLGMVGLTFIVSSLFSNVISTLALPVIPIFAVIFFHDRMDGVKVVAMLIAVWGFLSYIYQDYLDDSKAKAENVPTESSNSTKE